MKQSGSAIQKWLSEQLIEHNMSQAELSRRSGLTDQAISMYMNGHRTPEPTAVVALANAFRFPPYDALAIAGYAPQRKERPLLDQVIINLIDRLSDDDKDQVVDYINLLIDRSIKKNDSIGKKIKREA